MLNIVSLRLSCIVFICPFHEWIIFLYWKWITYKLHLPCTSRLRWRIFEPVAKPWLRANSSLRFKNYFFVSSISTYAAFVMLLFTKLIESLCRKNKFSDNHHVHYIHWNKCTSKTIGCEFKSLKSLVLIQIIFRRPHSYPIRHFQCFAALDERRLCTGTSNVKFNW